MAPRTHRPSRGRGRGRGNASATTGELGEDSHAQGEKVSAIEPFSLTLLTEGPPNEDLPTGAPLAEALPTETSPTEALMTEAPFHSSSNPSAVQHEEDGSQFPSPNTSPAPAPTETPASTPVRLPVQRLDSLGLQGRGGHSTGRGVGGRVMAGKFKPKAVTRRALVDRVQAQHEEDERRREREIEAQRERDINANAYSGMQGIVHNGSRNWEKVGIRGRGRGRGEAMGRGGIERNAKAQREASGLFGIAPAAPGELFHIRSFKLNACADPLVLLGKKPAPVPAGTSTTRERAASDSMDIDTQSTSTLNASFSRLHTKSTKPNISTNSTKVKQDPDILLHPTIDEPEGGDPDARSAIIKVEIPDPIYPEEQEEDSRPAPRVNIEQINLVTDDEEDDSDVVHSNRNKGKGRSLPNRGGLKPVRLQRVEHKERITLVNTEPAATTLTNDAKEAGDYQAFVLSDEEDEDQVESSRDSKKWSGVWQDDEVEAKHDPGASDDAMDVDIIEDSTHSLKSSHVLARQVGKETESTALASFEKGKTKLRQKPKKQQPVLQTEEDTAEHARYLEDLRILARELGGVQGTSANEKDAGTIDSDGESIAVQPRVKDHEGRLYLFQFPPVLPSLVNKIKKEEATDAGPELTEVEAGPSQATDTIDLTKPDPEEAVFIETPHGNFQVPPELVTEEGFVGKLIVRKSGKVQLDWGGTLLELGRGVEIDCLITTMIVEGLGEEGSSNESTKPVGTGTGIGKVMGNFVLTPDFEAMGEM